LGEINQGGPNEGRKIDDVRRGERSSKEIFVEIKQNRGFG
jgi:hypothetical protein